MSVFETYTKDEFFDACKKVLGEEFVNKNLKVPTNHIFFFCQQVAWKMLINQLKCSDTDVLRVIQVTAYNLHTEGVHKLKD